MQIFLPYDDFIKSAQAIDDRRLNTQITELAQIMSTVIWIQDCDKAETLYSQELIYLPTHENHPIVKWVCEDKKHVHFCIRYLYWLLWEYHMRFDVSHKVERPIFNILLFHFRIIQEQLDYIALRVYEYAQNFTTNHKHIDEPFKAYRKELNLKWNNDIMKGNYPKWTKRKEPEFFKKESV